MGRFTIALVSSLTFLGAAHGQGLPGGATSLSETHGDWQVSCEVVEKKADCAFLQTQVSAQNGQRIISVELQPVTGGSTANGVVVMPFGLALSEGITAEVGTLSPVAASFSTCLPAGCLAEVSFDAAMVRALKAGDVMTVKAKANGGNEEVKFSISLKGFSAALARAAELVPPA